MSKLSKLQYIVELEEAKEKLERKKRTIDLEIKEYQDSCAHIYAKLCYVGNNDLCRCALCGNEVLALNFDDEYEYVINAVSFLPKYTWTASVYCDIKYQYIQNFALSILKENPDMQREELFQKLKSLIKEKSLLDVENPAIEFKKI